MLSISIYGFKCTVNELDKKKKKESKSKTAKASGGGSGGGRSGAGAAEEIFDINLYNVLIGKSQDQLLVILARESGIMERNKGGHGV